MEGYLYLVKKAYVAGIMLGEGFPDSHEASLMADDRLDVEFRKWLDKQSYMPTTQSVPNFWNIAQDGIIVGVSQ